MQGYPFVKLMCVVRMNPFGNICMWVGVLIISRPSLSEDLLRESRESVSDVLSVEAKVFEFKPFFLFSMLFKNAFVGKGTKLISHEPASEIVFAFIPKSRSCPRCCIGGGGLFAGFRRHSIGIYCETADFMGCWAFLGFKFAKWTNTNKPLQNQFSRTCPLTQKKNVLVFCWGGMRCCCFSYRAGLFFLRSGSLFGWLVVGCTSTPTGNY